MLDNIKLSIIIPCYNEKETIERVINQLDEINLNKEVILVDDGSIDGSREKLKNLQKKSKIRVLYHQRNLGKGAAIKTALNFISGNFVIIQDADLEYSPADYQKLLKCALEFHAQVVYGSRRSQSRHKRYSSFFFYLGGIFLTWLTNILYGTRITDVTTCYKLFKTELIKNIRLKSKRFEFCAEVTAKIAKKGIKIYEVPIHYFPRKPNEGKKIKWLDGFKLAWSLIKYRFID